MLSIFIHIKEKRTSHIRIKIWKSFTWHEACPRATTGLPKRSSSLPTRNDGFTLAQRGGLSVCPRSLTKPPLKMSRVTKRASLRHANELEFFFCCLMRINIGKTSARYTPDYAILLLFQFPLTFQLTVMTPFLSKSHFREVVITPRGSDHAGIGITDDVDTDAVANACAAIGFGAGVSAANNKSPRRAIYFNNAIKFTCALA